MPTTAKKTATRGKKPTTFQPGQSVTLWYSVGIRSREPHEITEVDRCNQREVVLVGGRSFKLPSANVKPTQPDDGAKIELLKLRREIDRIDARELDNEAVVALAGPVRAWRERSDRRTKVVCTALRVALLEGPRTKSDLSTAAGSNVSYDSVIDYLRKIGVSEDPSSRQHFPVYQRTSTPEDHFDAVVFGMFTSDRIEVTMGDLINAVIAHLGGTKDEREPEVKASLARCGCIRGHGPSLGRAGTWMLQPFDAKGS